MKFTDLFIERPVLAIVVSSMLVLLGMHALTKLEVRQFPKLEKSVIHVRTVYSGASANTVEGFVTSPLQRRIAGATGVEYMAAKSDPGQSNIEVHVRLGDNTAEVLSEVIAKVNEAKFDLPRQIEDPVVTTTTGADAMMYLAFFSDEMSAAQITDYVRRNVQPGLTTLKGVGEAGIPGARDLAMRIWLDPARMAAYGVTAEDISEAVQRDNFISAAGSTKGQMVRATVDAQTYRQNPAEFAAIVVRQEGERRVLLGDVSKVELSSEVSEFASFSRGRETVFVSIVSAPGANPLDVARRVHELVPRLREQLPADLQMSLDYDAAIYIKQAMGEVLKTLLEAALIVVVVIYLFLGSLRVVSIALVAIPLSIIGVLSLMNAMGFSINLLTMLAMVIAIGLVVDDAIVVVENVHRYIEDGISPKQAAIEGARQVALPVVAMTLTLAAVFAPIGFIGGLTGTLFSEFALTLAGAVLVSGVVALTLTPMMCSRVLKDRSHQGGFASWLDRGFKTLRGRYQQTLANCLANRGAVLTFSIVIVLSLPAFFYIARQELAPEEDWGILYARAIPPSYANLEYINRFIDEMTELSKTVTEINYSWQFNSPNRIFGGIILNPWDQRERTQLEVQRDLQAKFSRISGLEVFTFAKPSLPGADSGLPVNFVVSSNADYEQVQRVAEQVLAAARQSGLFSFVNQSLRFNRQEIHVAIDRDKAARLGISMESIGETLAIMLGESDIGRFNLEGRSYKVIPQAARSFRLTKEWLQRYYLRTSSDELVPMSTLIELGQRVEPNTRRQYQQLNSSTIKGIMMPPNTLGDGLAFLESELRRVAPIGFQAGYEGESRRFVQENRGFGALMLVSLLVIFLVLAAQFNSFRDPFIVLISVPMSIFGAVVPIALGFATLNIYTQVGLLTLLGLISKHGILIVEFANQLAERGVSRHDAVLQAASLRLRPILMTTAATALGVAPLLLATGAGANSRFSIGLMIAAGMLVGTLFTLFIVPVFYMLLASDHQLDVEAPLSGSVLSP